MSALKDALRGFALFSVTDEEIALHNAAVAELAAQEARIQTLTGLLREWMHDIDDQLVTEQYPWSLGARTAAALKEQG